VRIFRRRSAPPITEALAYARCHGSRGHDITVVKLPSRPRRDEPGVSGETLRLAFEAKLADRSGWR
jgi:hypothetical protein